MPIAAESAADDSLHWTESRVMGLRYLEITGGNPLCGEITVQGSKNAALPILAACMLGDGPCTIRNCPRISDVQDLQILMERLGCSIKREGNLLHLDCKNMTGCEIIGAEAARIRSSILFLGALLGKMGKAVLPHPGGCAIGARPIDLHIAALEKLGVQFESGAAADCVCASCKRLHGGNITLAYPSVGATENVILAAVLADGVTVLKNAAREPEIDELCAFLNLRGAKIRRCKNGTIHICGVKHLRPVCWHLRSDRIVTGTYLLAVMASGGKIRIRQAASKDLRALFPVLAQMGAKLEVTDDSIVLETGNIKRDACWTESVFTTAYACQEVLNLETGYACRAVPYIETAPYPGFPTDLQSPLMAALCLADGKSVICEKVFESRFRTAAELAKMGACIGTDGHCACIYGQKQLCGAVLEAPDLRGGAALVAAALAAKGTTKIYNIEYIERGYEDICRDLRCLRATIQKGEDEWGKEPEEEQK